MATTIKHTHDRATVPAIEALVAAGNEVERAGARVGEGAALGAAQEGGPWTVYLSRPPCGIEVVRIVGTADVAIRLDIEPAYPGETPAAWHERGDMVPCPECGAALGWAEAGYVPGWRVCMGPARHFALLSSDGRSAAKKGRVQAGSQYAARAAVSS